MFKDTGVIITAIQTFKVKSSAPLMIVVSSCVSSPPLPAYDGKNETKQKMRWKNKQTMRT